MCTTYFHVYHRRAGVWISVGLLVAIMFFASAVPAFADHASQEVENAPQEQGGNQGIVVHGSAKSNGVNLNGVA